MIGWVDSPVTPIYSCQLNKSFRDQELNSWTDNLQFRRGFWAKSWEFSDLRFLYTMFTLQTSFKPLLLRGGGGEGRGVNFVSRGDCEGGKRLRLLSQLRPTNSTSPPLKMKNTIKTKILYDTLWLSKVTKGWYSMVTNILRSRACDPFPLKIAYERIHSFGISLCLTGLLLWLKRLQQKENSLLLVWKCKELTTPLAFIALACRLFPRILNSYRISFLHIFSFFHPPLTSKFFPSLHLPLRPPSIR
jgi:hypothetical protein